MGRRWCGGSPERSGDLGIKRISLLFRGGAGSLASPMASLPRAVLVGVQLPGVTDDEHRSSLDELGRLAQTLGLEVIGRVTQRRSSLEAGAVLGEGKLRELALFTGGPGEVPSPAPARKRKRPYRSGSETMDPDPELGAEEGDEGLAPPEGGGAEGLDAGRALELYDHMESGPTRPLSESERATNVLVDHDLSPSQARNLERAAGAEVQDRTSVILSIFHRHAQSREAKLEVEIARLRYLAPRLREIGGGGDRQRGGIGGRGAGESALELDRRKIRDRIAELQRELDATRRVARTQRGRRSAHRKAALVGYTNAGKSSMMRALTGSEVYVADELFATLGTTVRILPGVTPRVLISDTVGFIKKLPHDLVASFRATLEEAASAQLLLHVVDASDPAFRSQMEVTTNLLSELEATAPRLLLLNKIDRVDAAGTRALREEFPGALLVSAHDPSDVARVVDAVTTFFERDAVETEIFVPWSQHARIGAIHERCRVLSSASEAEGTRLRVRADRAVLDSLSEVEIPPPHGAA